MKRDEKQIITSLKSYLVFQENGKKRMIYSVGLVVDERVEFRFEVPEPGMYHWHMNTDFSLKIESVVCRQENEIQLEISASDDAKEILAVFEAKAAGEVTLVCEVEALSQEDSLQRLKTEYNNRVAHIRMLLQNERDLDAACERLRAEKNEQAACIERLRQNEHTVNDKIAELSSVYSGELEQLRGDLRCKEGHVEQLLQTERDLHNKITALFAEREDMRQTLSNREGHIELLLQSERDLQNKVVQLVAEQADMRRTISNREGHIEQLLQTERELWRRLELLADKHETVSEALRREKELLQQTLAEEREKIRAQQQQIQEKTLHYQRLIQEKDAAYQRLADEKDAAYQRLADEKDAAYQRLADEKDAAYQQLADEKNAAYQQMTADKDALYQQVLQEKDALSAEYTEELSVLQQTVRNKEGHIELLLESDRELERIKVSRSWRFMGYFWKLRDFIAPKGSKRRLLIKMIVKFIKHPIRFLSKCTPTRIGKFFKTLRREGAEGVSRRLDDCLIGNEIQKTEIIIEALPKSGGEEASAVKTASDYALLQVPQWENPTVSIVIPVYNQFDYTYLCVKSIIEHSGDVSYEILIADDCSTDLTTEIDSIIEGLHTIHNEQNLRFLRNCNNAAKQAKGKYILFLNNDTQVQQDWLTPLVSLIERAPDIGMVGSKLVYPDGRLQEAGGILWKDGSAWNFGNRSDPDAPEFNYVKEVDYISGAAIMIRKSLWEEIGGFDDRFAPAYCEDSDLAFEVRKHGYKVMYQPKSVVVHFEGVSNGTDTSSGQKSYQVVNQKKFFEKWKDVLEKEHNPNAENPFLARERGIGKKVLLMVDHYVPQFDKDAGSRTVYQYLQLFVDQGYHVKFIGDNFYPHQPYTEVLQQMGIEVLYGPYYAQHWKEWLKENGGSIHYAFLNRPHIAVNYIDEVRKYTPARIVYYGHDLHFLREQREYELTGDETLVRSAQEWQKKELTLMRKADMAYYPSYVEEEEIHRIAPDVNVKAIPAYLFREVEECQFVPENRKNIMFIGGFGHKPNVDAVKWLAQEIMPILEKRLPKVVVHILGSNPPEEIKNLATEHLRIEGFVTDEELARYYRTCRMAIVPLRYGAGIKGKVVEAMRYGMPVVTTSVGAEGLAGVGKILAIADNGAEFADRIVTLYNDGKSLKQRSRKSVSYIRENFSPNNAKIVVGPEFDME